MRTRQLVESAKRKAKQGRRVSLCGAGLRGNPGLTGYERAEASLELCRPHPPLSPPPASSSPSSFLVFLLLLFLPLLSTPQQLPPGKESGAEGGVAASTDSLDNFFNWGSRGGFTSSALSPTCLSGQESQIRTPRFPGPLSPL